MKKTRPSPKRKVQAETMPEVDFSHGVRGKYAKRLRASVVTVRIDGGVAMKVARAPRPTSHATSKRESII